MSAKKVNVITTEQFKKLFKIKKTENKACITILPINGSIDIHPIMIRENSYQKQLSMFPNITRIYNFNEIKRITVAINENLDENNSYFLTISASGDGPKLMQNMPLIDEELDLVFDIENGEDGKITLLIEKYKPIINEKIILCSD